MGERWCPKPVSVPPQTPSGAWRSASSFSAGPWAGPVSPNSQRVSSSSLCSVRTLRLPRPTTRIEEGLSHSWQGAICPWVRGGQGSSQPLPGLSSASAFAWALHLPGSFAGPPCGWECPGMEQLTRCELTEMPPCWAQNARCPGSAPEHPQSSPISSGPGWGLLCLEPKP